MIIGLPGAGKTTWGINKARDNPEMRYNIIGTDTLIDKMRVMGLPRKKNYHGRWDVLIDKASKCLNKLFEIGKIYHGRYSIYMSLNIRKNFGCAPSKDSDQPAHLQSDQNLHMVHLG